MATTPRFYTPAALSAGVHTLTSDAAHHARVLRLRVGDAVELFNGNGAAYPAQITNIDKVIELTISEPIQSNAELKFELHLAQALIEPSKMDWVVEKAVELGVSHFHPIAAMRSVTKLDAARSAKRVAHWQSMVIAASQQCGRNSLMQIAAPATIAQGLQAITTAQHLLLHPVGGSPLAVWCKSCAPQPVALWIGPEGGWTNDELAALETAKAQRITFGNRVLRTETAGLAVAAALQALWG